MNRTIEVLLAKHLKAWISYEGLQRIETLPVPEPALREAILNAVVHKEYASGIPIQISVYPDKLMIWNPGQLPHDWTVERLLAKHPSQPYNPDIANAFFRAGKIEAWGRGIERIVEACVMAGAPMPEVHCEAAEMWLVFHYLTHLGSTTQETTQETTKETTKEKIVELLKGRPSITRKELATKLGISANGIKYHLEKLKFAGIVRHVGPTKAGHWEVID